MQNAGEKLERRPFHKTVLKTIDCASINGLVFLAPLIKATSIPKGHDEIINAWKRRRSELDWSGDDLGVLDDLLEQKHEAEEKEKGKGQPATVAS